MGNEELQEQIFARVPEATFEEGLSFLEITIPSEKCHSLMRTLRDQDVFAFDYLFCLTGVDWPETLSVVYHLKSTIHEHSLVVKAMISSREHPKIDTVCDIWRTAEFHEREVYDLLGVVFTNHPDLRRIFLDDDWEGWPLRKDYVDEINIVEL